ncbi:hypothetical protein ACIQV3_40355 [Streptomyces sp. NPDC099050]|uniref:hypothetical protein n=1 Tax=Streptomyces sp. NPDC099050 TaxID=3366100 RepID=UPI0037F534D9
MAEAALRNSIAIAEHPDRFRRPLIELLGRQGRIEEAVEVGRPTFDHHDACLFEGIIHLLHEAGLLDDALVLLDERSAELVEEHSSWFSSNRIWPADGATRPFSPTVAPTIRPSGWVTSDDTSLE